MHQKEALQMVFFTADLHFGHANIIRHCVRPFASVAGINGFAPVTFAELVENNRRFKNAHTAPA